MTIYRDNVEAQQQQQQQQQPMQMQINESVPEHVNPVTGQPYYHLPTSRKVSEPLPKESLMDNIDLYVQLTKKREVDIMSITLTQLVSRIVKQPSRTVRSKEGLVVFDPMNWSLVLSFPSELEVSVPAPATVSDTLMMIVNGGGTEDDIMVFAESIDEFVKRADKAANKSAE